MRTTFEEQLERLNEMLIEMGELCEQAITYAMQALDDNSEEMREKTLSTDGIIEERQREIENLCFELLLRQQPVARDLRMVSASIKMINDMERIGDQACDIAEMTETLEYNEESISGKSMSHMAETVIGMVRKSVESFIKRDIELAKEVIIKDDAADELFDTIRDELVGAVSQDVSSGEYFVDILMIAKYLERTGDHAVNISRGVIYSVTGEHVGKDLTDEK